jgi:hypothetical protein
MEDKLQEIYTAWKANHPEPLEFQVFQGGVTAGAVSLRQRALEAIEKALAGNDTAINAAKNAVGSLSDI